MNPGPFLAGLLAGFIGGALFSLVGPTIRPFPAKSRVVQAEEFRLVDSEGTVRGWFRVSGGNAALCIMEKGYKSGAPRALMGVDAKGVPIVSLSEVAGSRVLLSVKDKGGSINLYSEAGRFATLGPDVVNLRDTRGEVRLSLAVLPNENPLVVFYDERGRAQTALGRLGTTDKQSSLVFLDKGTQVLCRAP
jgi:hypothetical protein